MRDLDTLKLWLEGENAAQANWRVSPDHRAQVSEFVNQYAATPGGKPASWMNSRIRRERELAARVIKEADRGQKEKNALVDAVRNDYISNGGTEKAFKARQASILEAYAVSGRSREVLDRAERERRSKAARTF